MSYSLILNSHVGCNREHLRGKCHCTVDLLLTGLEMCLCAVQNSVHPAQRHISKPVKQEVNRTVILHLKCYLVLATVLDECSQNKWLTRYNSIGCIHSTDSVEGAATKVFDIRNFVGVAWSCWQSHGGDDTSSNRDVSQKRSVTSVTLKMVLKRSLKYIFVNVENWIRCKIGRIE